VCLISVEAQKRKTLRTESAVVVDERLSVLRIKPSLYADPVVRMRRGRVLQILGSADGDGVKFYRVASSSRGGWIQREAVAVRSRSDDEMRLARLVQTADGFGRIELAIQFLKIYPGSKLRPAMLMLYGDLLEEVAAKLTRDAALRLRSSELAASGAPTHSYFLNFNPLDRYRRLGIRFLFNPSTRSFHYDGASWREIVQKHRASKESEDARIRLDKLKDRLEAGAPQ
jgi:hypothetical protein